MRVIMLLVGLGLLGVRPAAAEAAAVSPAERLVLDVDGAVRLALERSRELRGAELALTEAGEQVSEIWGRVFPQIDFSASYARNIEPAVSFVPARVFDSSAPQDELLALQFGADNAWQSTVRVEQPLFDPGLFVGIGAAERFRRLQDEMLRGRRQQVVTGVRLICYELLLRTYEVTLTERSLARVRQALDDTQARARVGVATDYDVLRLQVELANLEPGLLRARNARASARRQLALELDIDDPARLELAAAGGLADTTALPQTRGLLDSTEVLVRQALAARSDVRQAEHTTDLRAAELRRQQVDYLPTVALFGSWDVQAQQNGGPDFFGSSDTRATSKMAGVRIDLPLFTGLQRDARIDQKQAAMRQAETQAQLARDRAAAQIRDLVEALAEAGSRERGQRLARRQAQRGFEIAMARYRRGVGSRLEVTDAEVALRQSEFNHAQAAHDVHATRARLDQALGRAPDTGPQDPDDPSR